MSAQLVSAKSVSLSRAAKLLNRFAVSTTALQAPFHCIYCALLTPPINWSSSTTSIRWMTQNYPDMKKGLEIANRLGEWKPSRCCQAERGWSKQEIFQVWSEKWRNDVRDYQFGEWSARARDKREEEELRNWWWRRVWKWEKGEEEFESEKLCAFAHRCTNFCLFSKMGRFLWLIRIYNF